MAGRKIGEAFIAVRPDTARFTKDAEPGVQQSGESIGGRFRNGFLGALGGVGTLVAGVVTAGVGAAVAVAGAAVIPALVGAMSKQDVTAALQAQLGLTVGEAQRAGATAGRVYANNFGQSLQDVAGAFTTVTRAQELLGDGTDATLQRITEKALTLRDVFGQDLNASVRAAQQLIRNGLAPDADAAFDLIAVGIQRGLDKSDDFLDTLNEYSTEFRSLGLEGPQALGLIQQALQAGARDSDTVADAIKEFAIRSKDASTTSAAAFKKLGLDAKEMTATFARGGPEAAAAFDLVVDKLREVKDPVDRNTAAIGLFGTKAEDLQDALFALDPSEAANSFTEFEGAVTKASDAVGKTASANLESLKRQLETGLTEVIGGRIIPVVTQFTGLLKDRLGPTLTQVGQWVQENVTPRLRELAEYTQTKVVPVVNDLARNLRDGAGNALQIVKKAIEDNRPQLEQLLAGLKAVAQFIIEKVVPIAGPILKASLESIGFSIGFVIRQISFWVDAFNGLRRIVTEVVAWVKDKIGELLNLGEQMRETGRNIVRGIWEGITSLAGWLADRIKGFVKDNITGLVSRLLGERSPSRVFWKKGVNTVLGYAGGIRSAANEVQSALTAVMPTAAPTAPSAAGGGGDLVRALETALERVLSRATLRIDDRSARFADLLVRGG